MKSMFLLFLFGTILTFSEAIVPTIDLDKAIESNQIKMQVNGNPESTHYLKPVLLSLENTSKETLKIRIPAGLTFIAQDSTIQDVIVTEETLIALEPGKEATQALYAMCIEPSNSGNNEGIAYSLGPMASKDLVELAEVIDQRKDHNIIGQNAIWALVEEPDLGMISGIDTTAVAFYRYHVAGVRNIPVPEFDPDDYQTNYHDPGLIQRSAKGNFKYRFSKTSHVSIALFDEQGIVVRELYDNPEEAPGQHELSFEFDMEVYQDDVYYVRLIQDDQVQIEFKMASNRG